MLYIKGKTLRLILAILLLCVFESHACSTEAAEDFKPFAIEVSSIDGLVEMKVLFPINDKSASPKYLDSLALHVPSKLTVDLSFTLSDSYMGYYLAEVSINESLLSEARLVGSYNFDDIEGNSMSLCANWKSFSVIKLLATEVIDV